MNEEQLKPYQIVKGQKVSSTKKSVARTLRKNLAPTEQIVWQRLRNSQLGVRFRRQQIIEGFIADFYCHEVGLVVEIDGPEHDKEYDSERDLVFASRGIAVLRFRNEEALHHIEQVIEKIKREIDSRT